MNDSELLAEYVKTRSDAAFAQLMLRHVDLVYSSALRQTRDPDAAEEITQAVFVVLSQKAHALGPRDALSPWLYNATRIAALDARRQAARRRHHEQRAHSMAIEHLAAHQQSSGQWSEIAASLDDALAGLNPNERAAIVLRYFDNRSVRDVSGALGVSEDAAEKRVARALQKLRLFFARRGKMLSLPALALLIGSRAVHAAPAEVITALPAKVAAAKLGLAGSHLTLAKGVLKIMATTQMLKTAGMAAACVILGCVGTLTVEHGVIGTAVAPPQAEPALARPALDEPETAPGASEGMVAKRPALAAATKSTGGRQTVAAAAANNQPAYGAPAAAVPGEPAVAAYPVQANGFQTVEAVAQPETAPGASADTLPRMKMRSISLPGAVGGSSGMGGAGGGGRSTSARRTPGMAAVPSQPGVSGATGFGSAGGKMTAAGGSGGPGGSANAIQIEAQTGKITLDRNQLNGDEVYVIEEINAAPAAGEPAQSVIIYRGVNGELPALGSDAKARIIAPGKQSQIVITADEIRAAVPVKPPMPSTPADPKAPSKEKTKEEF